LANSVVQVVVDAEGRPISATLYPDDSGPGPRTFGSGLKEADEQALALAKAARFNPMTGGGPDRVTSPTAQLTWGRMIFQWHTLPVATNAPPATPQP